MSREPRPVEQDTRGILDPWLLRRHVALTRYPAGPELDGLIAHFWAVRWNLPPATQHHQQVLTYPGANLSVAYPDARTSASDAGAEVEARLNGVARRLSERVLVGYGWGVAAMTTPGGLGAFIREPASRFTDRVVPLGQAIAVDEAALVRAIQDEADAAGRVARLRDALERALVAERVTAARRVAEVARLAETDRALRQLGDLSRAVGIGQRTLQRLFLDYAGVSPTWVLRRCRLLEVAEAVRGGEQVLWTAVAADLGYADQAHLIREFRAATGRTPAAYARAQGAGATKNLG